jgi:hypothetical protein
MDALPGTGSANIVMHMAEKNFAPPVTPCFDASEVVHRSAMLDRYLRHPIGVATIAARKPIAGTRACSAQNESGRISVARSMSESIGIDTL